MADRPEVSAAKNRLRKFDDAYSEFMRMVIDSVAHATDDDLARLIADCDSMTGTNCSWTMYRAAKIVRSEASDEQMIRARVAKEAATDG